MSAIRYPSWAGRASATRLACFVALVLSLLLSAPARVPAARSLTGTVTHVVDGDTIAVLLDGHAVKVRYIGMDTPETRHPIRGEEPGGREAAAVNRRLVLGKTVRLELDVREWDRYRRLLAYVYVGDVMINAELVRLGCAHAVMVPPNVAHARHLARLEREAREARRGLWGHPSCGETRGP
jgi:micrococcal nuclease